MAAGTRPARLTRPEGAATLARAYGGEPRAGTGACVIPSDIAYLALGLLLGSAVGAALAHILARRQGPRREVRVTITPNALPSRRAYTLAVPGGISLAGS